MGFMKCPFCEQEIDSSSKKCFFCDSDLSRILNHEDSKKVSEQQETVKNEHSISLEKITLLFLLGAAFLGMAFFLISHFN